MDVVSNITGSVGGATDIDYVTLYNGSNLIALPKQPSNTSIDAVMANITGKFERVDYYNSQTGTWLVYNPAAPFGNTLTTIEKNKAYWIHMTAPATLYIS